MRNLIRSPLTWMVVAEVAVVGALLMVAWGVVASTTHRVSAAPAATAVTTGEAAADDGSGPPDIPSLTGEPSQGPPPGLSVSPAFWRQRLAELNRDQIVVAQLEWRLVHAGMTAARDYVEGVVLPAVRRAEGAAVG